MRIHKNGPVPEGGGAAAATLLLEEEERENLKKLRDSEIALTQQLGSLSKMIEQMESMCHNSILKSFEVRLLENLIGKKTM